MIPYFKPQTSSETIDYFISTYQPSYGKLFSESVNYGFANLWWKELIDEMRYDNAAAGQSITEQEYNESAYFRNDIKHFEGMTLQQAEILAEANDRNVFYSQITNNVTGFGNIVQLAGTAVGSAVDPLAFVPYVGIAKKGMKAIKIGKKMQNVSKNIPANTKGTFGTVIRDSADASIGLGIGAVLVKEKRAKFQEEWDARMVLTEMAIGGLLAGGTIAGIKKFQNRNQRVLPEDHMSKIAMVMDQLEMGKSPDLSMHQGKGLRYLNTGVNYRQNDAGSLSTSVGKMINDVSYLTVDVLMTTPISTAKGIADLIRDTITTSNSYGYKGIYIPDTFLNPSTPDAKIKFEEALVELADADVKIEVRPDENGITIERITTSQDDIKWDYKDVNEQYIYKEQPENMAQTIQQNIKSALGQFVEIPEKVKTRIQDIRNKSEQVNKMIDERKQVVLDAAKCLTSNGSR
tara:strand:+ start:3438 stop:4820 length:1383 start_codon:yes stop_codon:yes gene_type:complete